MKPLEGGKISGRQFFSLLVIIRLVPQLLVLPTHLYPFHHQLTWLVELLGILLALPFTYFVVMIGNKFPGKTIIEYAEVLLGPVLGKFLGLFLVFNFIFTAASVARYLGEAFTISIMPETPILVFIISIIFMAAFAARNGIEVIARIAENSLPIVLLFILLICLLPFKSIQLEFLKPFYFPGGIIKLIGPTESVLVFYLEFFIISMLIPYLNRTRDALKYSFLAVIVSGFFIIISSLALITVFGPTLDSLPLPLFSLARMIEIANFFERIEGIIIIIWILSTGIKISLFLWAGAIALGQIFKQESYHHLAYPLGSVIAVFSILFFKSLIDLLKFLLPPMLHYSIFFTTTILVIIIIGKTIRNLKGGI